MAGDPASGQPRPPQGGQTQALQVLSSTGTQNKEETHPGPNKVVLHLRMTEGRRKVQPSGRGRPGALLGEGGQRGPRLVGLRAMPRLLGRACGWLLYARVIRGFRSPKKVLVIFYELSEVLWMGSLKRASPPGSLTCI